MKISKDRIRREIREWTEAILVALILTLVIRTFVVQAFKIPSESMYPTLMVGDKLFVNKFIYRFRDPQRGEVIVFKYPENPSKDFIKRVIGIPGDSVEIRNGSIFINDKKWIHPDEIRENLYYNQEPYAGAGQKLVIPTDAYFVLGDNSISSRDSRYWGFVPKDLLVGKAFVRWWPLNRMGRLDRLFHQSI